MAVSCIHGESTRYPVTDIDVTIRGNQFRVRTGVSDKLLVPLLLGRDVPKLSRVLVTCVGSTSSRSSVSNYKMRMHAFRRTMAFNGGGVLNLINRAVSEKTPQILGPSLPAEYMAAFSGQTQTLQN